MYRFSSSGILRSRWTALLLTAGLCGMGYFMLGRPASPPVEATALAAEPVQAEYDKEDLAAVENALQQM